MTTPPRLPLEPPPLIEHTVAAEMRDADLYILGRVRMTFTYDQMDPFALRLTTYDPRNPSQDKVEWLSSRDAFLAPVLHNSETPSMDLSVRRVVLTRGSLGRAHPSYAYRDQDVQCIRVSMYPSACEEVAELRGRPVHFDIDLADVRPYFEDLVQAVRPGTEHKLINWDALIDFLRSAR